MSKPVDKIEFWANRITNAAKEHYSVFVCNDTMWNAITESHTKIITKLIKDTDKVLDAGCGYGRMCTIFKPENYKGVDFSPDFIAKAKEKYPAYDFQVGKLEKLPFKDKEFDWAFCVSMKVMIKNNLGDDKWLEMEKELKRVAKNLLILEYTDYEEYEIS